MPIPTLDFETYSEAGLQYDPTTRKWSSAQAGSVKRGLALVGAGAYSEHPSTEVLTCSYDLCDGRGTRRWRPGDPLPHDLFAHVYAPGAVLESHKAMFERLIWTNVCCRLYGWPPLPVGVQRCSMATAHVAQYPGSLENLGDVLRLDTRKDKDGKRLIQKFCVPRNPTKADPRTRIRPEDDPEDFERLCLYCDRDVDTEMAAADRLPPMTADELQFWLVDQEINWRGLGIDRPAVRDCIAVMNQVLDRYGQECLQLTGFSVTQLQALIGWMAGQGYRIGSLDADHIEAALSPDSRRVPPPPHVRRVLELRQLTGSASVKKVYGMELQACADDRLRDLIIHHGTRTGRPTGGDVQPLNLPKSGPTLTWCACERPHKPEAPICPWCGAPVPAGAKRTKWNAEMVDHVLAIMATRSIDMVEHFFGDALLCISGVLRGLFVAAPGHDLIASDYSAIEAVVAAQIAGEQWRIDAFKNNEPIYLVGASKITGTPLQSYLDYHAQHGEHHPDRQNIGKVSELACGFGGWINSYKAFGSTEDDDTIKQQILAWRAASPAIVEMWGGQTRGLPWDRWRRPERYGLEGMAVNAVEQPGTVWSYRGISFQWVDWTPGEWREQRVWEDTDGSGFAHLTDRTEPYWHAPSGGRLMVTLPSGRQLTYHEPELAQSDRAPDELSLSYMTWNSNPNYGAIGWVRMSTFGGRLFENVVQAIAHDILRYAILLLRRAGYPTVLHVYDEIVVEVPVGTGSLDEVERIMQIMAPWATGWPVRAAGGWRGRRFRKG